MTATQDEDGSAAAKTPSDPSAAFPLVINAPPPVKSAAPSSVGLKTGSSPITSVNPEFTVSGVANGASVTVSAVKGNTTVTKTVSASGASVDVPFTGSTCGAGGSSACALSVGSWSVTATHDRDGAGTAYTVSDPSPAFSLIINAPPVTPTTPVAAPVVFAVSVANASSVTEGEPLLFPISVPQPATRPVEVHYTVSGLGDEDSTGSETIDTGSSVAEISVATDNDQLDSDNLTVRVTLTSATGGASIDPQGSTATGIVKDDDTAPTVGIKEGSASGSELRFTFKLNTRSARDVRVSYTTSLGGRGTVRIAAGEIENSAVSLFDPAALPSNGVVRLRLTSAQHATIDLAAREQNLFPRGDAWQFHVTSRAGVTPAQLAETFGLAGGALVFVWNAAAQRWDEPSNDRAALPAGATVTFRGAQATGAQLDAAGLGRSTDLTLRQGWNIFTPAEAAVGLTASDFQQVTGAAATASSSAVIFDPQLIDCDDTAGLLVIYTYDQADPQAANGFRLALPCHPQVQADSDIPAITAIDKRDVIYAWFRNTTPATVTFANGRYTPA